MYKVVCNNKIWLNIIHMMAIADETFSEVIQTSQQTGYIFPTTVNVIIILIRLKSFIMSEGWIIEQW